MTALKIDQLTFTNPSQIECYHPLLHPESKKWQIIIHTHAKAYAVQYETEDQMKHSLKQLDAIFSAPFVKSPIEVKEKLDLITRGPQ